MTTEGSAPLPAYRVIQLTWNARRGPRNEGVDDFDDLVTHHPEDNQNARIVAGEVVGGQRGRRHAVLDGEIQEIAWGGAQGHAGLQPEQVLVKKDFMLEDSRLPTGPGSRAVDVPAPVSGVIGTVNARQGLVDILDRVDGEVIARVRHLNPIHLATGDAVEYGQALGTQGRQATAAIHVHMEVDTRYYQQYENYLQDLVDGRLMIDPDRRDRGIEPRELIDDGVIRIGESSDVVRMVQERLNAAGYVDADQRPLSVDGVYRLSMQAAVINYQQANGLPASGDLDAATLQHIVPRMMPPPFEAPRHGDRGMPPGPMNLSGEAPTRETDPMLAQARAAVEALDRRMGREYDATSDRMAASLTVAAREAGLDRIDHVVLSVQSGRIAAGEHVFAVQGALGDPAHLRTHLRTDAAVQTPVEQSLQRLAELDASLAQASQRDLGMLDVQQAAQREQQEAPRRVMA